MSGEKGFFSKIGDGLGYGLGGGFGFTIGQELARFVIRWIKRLIIVIALGGSWGVATMLHPESPFEVSNTVKTPQAQHHGQKQAVNK